MKTIIRQWFCLFLLTLGAVPVNGAECASVDGLVAWWRGDDNAEDGFGAASGTVVAGTTFTSGRIGKAFSFNGEGGCVTIPFDARLIPSTYSVELWVKPLSRVNDPVGAEFVFGQNFGKAQITVRPGESGLKVVWGFGQTYAIFPVVISRREIPINAFSHIVGTWDGQELRLYIDGTLDSTLVPNTRPQEINCPFSIGGAHGSCLYSYFGQYFNGVVDEVSLFNRPITGAEVQQLFAADAAGKCLDVVSRPPIIDVQPQAKFLLVGQTLTLEVRASGPAPIFYQWYFDNNPISDATNAILSKPVNTRAMSGAYHAVVTNPFATVTSEDAVVTVDQLLPEGILVSWKERYFGTNYVSVPAAGTAQDADGDGANNFQEHQDGTDPTDSNSIRRVPIQLETHLGSIAGSLDGPASEALFVAPGSATLRANGEIWMTEATFFSGEIVQAAPGAHRIRVLDAKGDVVTIVGGTEPGFADGSGAEARFRGPHEIVFDSTGNAFVSDRLNHRIRRIDAELNVTTFAGGSPGLREGAATEAQFNMPSGLAIDSQGNIYAADAGNHRIRKVETNGVVSTFSGSSAGRSDGPLLEAKFTSPIDVAIGSDGTIYVADAFTVRRISNDGTVNTIASDLSKIGGISIGPRETVLISHNWPVASLQARSPDGTVLWRAAMEAGMADGVVEIAKAANFGSPLGLDDDRVLLPDSPNRRYRLLTLGVRPLLSIAPASRDFSVALTVTMAKTVPDGVIRYTMDGTDPNANSAALSGSSLVLRQGGAIRAAVFLNGVQVSPVRGEQYSLVPSQCANVPGLVGWWPGESSAGDLFGSLNGTVLGAGFGSGAINNCFYFDGQDDHVSIPYSPLLNLTHYTVEFWVKPVAPVSDYANAEFLFGQLFGKAQVTTRPGSNGVRIAWGFGVTYYDFATVISQRVLPLNEFSHFVGTWDGQKLRLYINGQLDSEKAPGTVPQSIVCPWAIGGISGGCDYTYEGQFFNGALDEIGLWSRALGSVEVQQLFESGAAGKCPEGASEKPPVIYGQPSSLTIHEGREVTFSVGVGGTSPLEFQWLFQGTNILGATNFTYVISQARLDHAGAYQVQVKNAFGAALSEIAMLQVSEAPKPPNIKLHPVSQTAVLGSEVTFTVQAEGEGSLSYQWFHDGSMIRGGSGRDLVLSNLKWAQGGEYAVRVSNAAGYILSGSARLTIVTQPQAPLITMQPQSLTIPVQSAASFSVIASGSVPLSYQWFWNGSAISGATDPVLVITNAQTLNAGTYTVHVRNAAGEINSAGAVLTVRDVLIGGTINFKNLLNLPEGAIDAPVFDLDGTRIAGSGFLAQLYAGTNTDTLLPVGAAVPFGEGARAGYWDPGNDSLRVVAAVVPGEPAVVQARVWEASYGATYELSRVSGGKVGISDVLVVVTGGDDSPPTLPANLVGLTSFSLRMPPRILVEPQDREITDIDTAEFTVNAAGSELLAFQWRWNGEPILGATNRTLSLSPGELLRSGGYSVSVSNDLGTVTSRLAQLTVIFVDRLAPAVVVTAPTERVLASEKAVISGTAQDNIGVVSLVWEWDGAPMGEIALTDASFSLPAISLRKGTNAFMFSARDVAGNTGSLLVELVWDPQRVLRIGDTSVQEGRRIAVPVYLVSTGDVSGLTAVFTYDTNYLADPVFEWDAALSGALRDVNLSVPGQIRAALGLAGTSLSSGTQAVAAITLRALSVPNQVSTEVGLDLLDLADTSGNPISEGTFASGGKMQILPRKIAGDINGNDRLDVGDAVLMLRLITQLDPPRSWDSQANDVNGSGRLDSGDIIRVMRVAAGIDPDPVLPTFRLFSVGGQRVALSDSLPGSRAGLIIVGPDPLIAGQSLTVRVELSGLSGSISGSAFSLFYPVSALRLANSQAHTTGAMVPGDAVVMWNVAPALSDYSQQTGKVSVAISSARRWDSANGIVAEFIFTVQPGAADQYRWPIMLGDVEVSSNGYDNFLLPGTQRITHGRTARPPTFSDAIQFGEEGFSFVLDAEIGAIYRIEVSEDLKNWTDLKVIENISGKTTVVDREAVGRTWQFYRAVEIPE